MKVQLLDLAAQSQPLRAESMEANGRVVDTSRFILGAEDEKQRSLLTQGHPIIMPIK